jgi:hypothetical protein
MLSFFLITGAKENLEKIIIDFPGKKHLAKQHFCIGEMRE